MSGLASHLYRLTLHASRPLRLLSPRMDAGAWSVHGPGGRKQDRPALHGRLRHADTRRDNPVPYKKYRTSHAARHRPIWYSAHPSRACDVLRRGGKDKTGHTVGRLPHSRGRCHWTPIPGNHLSAAVPAGHFLLASPCLAAYPASRAFGARAPETVTASWTATPALAPWLNGCPSFFPPAAPWSLHADPPDPRQCSAPDRSSPAGSKARPGRSNGIST